MVGDRGERTKENRTMQSIAILAITDSSEKTAHSLKNLYPGESKVFRPGKGELQSLVNDIFNEYDGLVFIMASGIVVRMIASLVTDKYNDPAVVTVDDARRYAISTLSGHEGGANWLTWKVASLLNCEPVVTTASDTNKNIVLGIGCRKGMSSTVIKEEVLLTLEEQGLETSMVRIAASVEIKKNEAGLIQAMDELEIPILFVSVEELQKQNFIEVTPSEITKKHFDIPGVCEPCALIKAHRGRLIMTKRKNRGVTLALVEENLCLED
jgi:cobalamin biosynthesis protein CbiG